MDKGIEALIGRMLEQIRISNRKIMQIRKGLLYVTTWANTRNPSASQNRAAKRRLNHMTEWERAE